MSELASDALLEFVESVNRLGYTRIEIAVELVALVRNGADWPRKSVEHWLAEIDKAVLAGKLRIDRSEVVTMVVEDKVKQLELF